MQAMKKRTLPAFSDQLRTAIKSSSLSRYRIAQQTGVSQSVLSLFGSGRRGLSLKAIDALVALLNLELKPRKTTPERKES